MKAACAALATVSFLVATAANKQETLAQTALAVGCIAGFAAASYKDKKESKNGN